MDDREFLTRAYLAFDREWRRRGFQLENPTRLFEEALADVALRTGARPSSPEKLASMFQQDVRDLLIGSPRSRSATKVSRWLQRTVATGYAYPALLMAGMHAAFFTREAVAAAAVAAAPPDEASWQWTSKREDFPASRPEVAAWIGHSADIMPLPRSVSVLERLAQLPWPTRPLSGHDFEKYAADQYSRRFPEVKRTRGSRDFGVDLIVLDERGRRWGIQLKHLNAKAGVPAVQAALAGKSHYGLDEAVVASTLGFTAAAMHHAKRLEVHLIAFQWQDTE